MNVLPMSRKVLRITNAMIRKPSLPNFFSLIEFETKRVGVSTLDELNRSLNRDIACWR